MSFKNLNLLLFSCFFLSGATALIYEVAWVRHMSLIFGSTAFAVSTVLTAYMAGLALGSYLFGRWIDRHGSPLLIYASLEIVIGFYALFISFLFAAMVPLYQQIWALFHPQYYLFSLIRFVLAFLILMIPTTAMGGTLPVLSKFYVQSSERFTTGITALYAVNTFGAVLGTILSGFILIPTLGLSKTIWTASGVNFALATLIFVSVRLFQPYSKKSVPSSLGPGSIDNQVPPRNQRLNSFILISFAITGFAALALEVVWTRLLAMILGPSVYAFSIILATFLIGLALGSFIFSRVIQRWKLDGLKSMYGLQILIGIFSWVTLLFFHQLPFWFSTLFFRWGGKQASHNLFSIEFLISFAATFLPTLLMGGIFPAILELFESEQESTGKTIGRLYAANTMGSIVGAFCGGFVLLPILGIQKTILFIIFLYLGLSAITGWLSVVSRRGRLTLMVLPLVAILMVLFFTPSWHPLAITSGAYRYVQKFDPTKPLRPQIENYLNGLETLFYHDGTTATISIAREKNFIPRPFGDQLVQSLLLFTNGKIDASSYTDMPTQILSGHYGPLLQDDPKEVLLIGLASGTTAGSLLRYPIHHLKVLELEPAVVQASHFFDNVNHRPLEDPRSELIVNDGRNYLLVTPEKFDLIVSEPSNPWVSGPSHLFTRDFFEIAQSKLNHNGLFVQWLQTYSLSPENLRILMSTFHSAFPHVMVFSGMIPADLLLVGSKEPIELDWKRIQERMRDEKVKEDLSRIQVEEVSDLLARFRLGENEVSALVQGVPLNTDDNALIEFAAPKDLYQPTRELNSYLLSRLTHGITPYLTFQKGDEIQRAIFLYKLQEAQKKLGLKPEADERL